MTNKIDRTKTKAKSVGARTLAMVLCFVMLLTAIGSGSILSAIAADFEGNGAAVLVDAAKAGADVDAPAIDEAEESSDILAPEDIDDGFVLTKKRDVDIAETGFQRQDFTYVHFVGDDLSGSGFDTQYFTSYDGANHYTGTWYIKNKNSDYANSEYNYYIKVHGKVKENDSYNYYLSMNNTVFGTNTGEHNGSSDADCVAIYESNGNMTFKTMPTSTGWVALQVNFWGDWGGNARVGLYQTAVPALVASGKTLTANGGESKNVMPSITGGTGNTNRSYTVRDAYGNTVDGCMSGDNFTAPYVTESTDYYIDATVTDSNISTLVDTATVKVTVSPKLSDWYIAGSDSFFGNSWNTTDSNNRMIQTGAKTFVKYYEIKSQATDVEFKFVKNSNTWIGYSEVGTRDFTGNAKSGSISNNGGNFKFSTTGNAHVTFTFYDAGDGDVSNNTMSINAVSATEYTTTINDADTAHNYSTAIATASPASCYEGTRVTIATTPKTGYVARVSLTGGVTATKSGNNFYFNMPASDVTATVTYEEASAIPVTVYANSGGSVNVLYGSAAFTVSEGDHDTIKVNEGDSISLTAVPDSEHSFSKWFKNLNNNYSSTASITETIDSKQTYVASFAGASGSTGFDSSSYTTVGTNFSIKYSTGNNSEYQGSNGTALGGTVYRNGSNDYYIELSSEELTAWKSASGQVRWNLFYNNTAQITDKNGYDAQYYDPATSALKNCEDGGDNTLLIKSKPDDYSGTVFIELSNIDSTITSLGIHINTSTKKVDYYFGTSSGAGSVEYVPSTNFYAKDSSVRDGNYNYWIYNTKTTVTEVTDQVRVDADHVDSHKWVEGYAMKGSEITVTTIIPHRGRYKYTDRTGHSGDGTSDDFKYADDKYYVAGFSFNGVTPVLLKESDGVEVTDVVFKNYNPTTGADLGTTTTANGTAYSCTYTIPVTMKEAMLEITPIIFVKDAYASETVMVYINGYNESVKDAGWGNTLYMYPFYQYYQEGSSDPKATYFGQGENFGRYPGQPIINYGGQLFCQIPLTDDASKDGKDGNGGPIKGITINNGYYDDVHKTYCNHVSVHRQTYDYDDFAKIYNEKKTKNGSKYLYSIYFSFKFKDKDPSEQHRLANTTNGIKKDENASRYNDLVASGNILNDTTGTVSASTLETAGDNSGGWEYLRDALGNKVDLFGDKIKTDDEAVGSSVVPLRVFSLGYEYNNAGRWATEWAVYHKNGDNYNLIYDDAWGIDSTNQDIAHNSSIVPSALIFNDKTSLANAGRLDGDIAINGYAGLYEKLEAYRGIPVKICYEYDIPDSFSPNNYRCDGRWTYTTTDDFVRSNIKIQYYDKNGVLHDDTYANDSSVVGVTTGCSAYFTNSEYYGERVSKSEIIDNSKSYTFRAENVGSYEFVGWYMYDTAGHESTITTTSKTAETPRSGNFVLAARYKYIASGNLTISNTLKGNSVGRGTTYLGVSVKNGDKVTPIANVNSNTSSVTLDKTYINANSNYQIIVDLRTVASGENTFKEYLGYTTDGHTGTDVRSAASDTDIYNIANKTNTTETYTITVKGDIFDSTTTNQQNVKAIEYISELNPVKYNYSVKFNYTSRQYGDQAFTQTGELTAGQISDINVVTGTSGTADKKLTEAFLAKIAPHESNFNENVTWDFDAVVNNQSCTYNSGTNTYTISLEILNSNAVYEKNVKRTGYFTVPYAQTNGTPTKNGDVVAKAAADTTFSIDVNYNEYFKIGDNFVTAPAVIVDNDAELPFQYWEISTVTSNRGESRVIGRCYFPEFNYRCLDNYNIKAVYGDSADAAKFSSLYSAEQGTSVAFIGNSRNQWNNGDNGTATADAGDIIYNDFIVSCKPKGNTLFNSLTAPGTKCGVVIQQVKAIEINSSGTNAKTLQQYAADYKTSDLETAQAAALALAKSGSASNTANSMKQRLMTIANANINEKNRCHYSLPMSNTKDDNGGLKNAKYLYRAYSYMAYDEDGNGTVDNDEWFISDAPAYFYMYDIAVA